MNNYLFFLIKSFLHIIHNTCKFELYILYKDQFRHEEKKKTQYKIANIWSINRMTLQIVLHNRKQVNKCLVLTYFSYELCSSKITAPCLEFHRELELSFYFRIKPTTTNVHLRTLLPNKKGYMNIAINAQF